MATTIAHAASPSRSKRAPALLNVGLAVAAMWFFGGLLLDGWAHNHLDMSKENFFTPYHAAFYSGFCALSFVLAISAWNNRSAERPWYRWFPLGYDGMAIGAGIFAVGGLLDMLWHITFGIEQDTQALYSPTHLLLAVGGATMMTGAIRAGMVLHTDGTWKARAGELLALSLFGTLITFFTMWAFGTGAAYTDDPHLTFPALTGAALAQMRELQVENGITAVILRSLVMAGITGWAARKLSLPFGAISFLVVIPNLLIALMLDPEITHLILPVVSGIVAGLAGDIALARWGQFEAPSWRTRTFAFGIPFLFWAVYLGIAYVTLGGFWWTPHAAYGAPVIGGLMGLLLSLSGEARTAAKTS